MKNLEKSLNRLRPGMVAVIGLPWDENSSFMQGPALAPTHIREALKSGSTNLCSETEIDLGADPRFLDLGDVELARGDVALQQIEKAISNLLEKGTRVLALGGDHAVTYPILKAYGKKYDKLNILHLDAHPDLYDEFEGNRYANACPFARIMEENLAARLVQVGIRTMNPHQRKQANRFGVEVIERGQWLSEPTVHFDSPIYLSLDLDVLDPAFAPGVSHPEPGGFSTRDVLTLIQGLRVPILGADIVEMNPKRDSRGITAMAAAKLLKETAARMLEQSRS